jgi:hypothetical protein
MKRNAVLMTVMLTLLMSASFAQQAAPAPDASTPQPRVYLQASSKGNVWNAARDQSMEMAKDFQKNCPDVKITIAQNAADYTVILNHVETGPFGRDNQFQVANKDGDMLGGVREKSTLAGGSIKGGVKAACNTIMSDWKTKQSPAAAAAPANSAPTPATYQGGAQVQTAAQTTTDGNSQDADAARKAQQYQACLALAKDNPSVVCNK